jgi:sialate O-acetylesterase
MKRLLSAAVFAGTVLPCSAEVKLHALFTPGAVLQREAEVPVWGTADPGESVKVSFAGQTHATVARNGQWMVKLAPLPAGGPHVLTVEGDNKIEVPDVLVGDVWLCSGQSNMELRLQQTEDGRRRAAAANVPELRFFTVPMNLQNAPQRDVAAAWEKCDPKTAARFSAVAYYFGRELHAATKVPVGLIQASVGGTKIDAWTAREGLSGATADRFKALETREAARGARPERAASRRRPSVLYNGMIAPLVPCALRGVAWYQGESDAGDPAGYALALPKMIKGWRSDFGRELPFLIVQLPPWESPEGQQWAPLREVQRAVALETPKCALIVTTDCGDARDIHPKRKEPIGQRLALAARALANGEEITWSGPMFRRATFGGGRATLRFDQVGGGLVAQDAPDGRLDGFTIAGANQRFVPAEARIEGDAVVVTSEQVPEPAAVRYAWANTFNANLWNQAGLPASPFRTDDWPVSSQGPRPERNIPGPRR